LAQFFAQGRGAQALDGASLRSASARLWTAGWAVDSWIAWRIALILLLCAELVALTLPFDFLRSGSLSLLFTALKGTRPALVTTAFVVILLCRRELLSELGRVRSEERKKPERSGRWLAWHFLLLAVLFLGTALRGNAALSASQTELWITAWVLMGLGALVSWGFALLPPRFWPRLLGRVHRALVIGFGAGWIAYVLGNCTQALWPMFQASTFSMVYVLLRAVVGVPAVFEPAQSIIGTSRFSVRIVSACSGLEGMTLIACLLAVYLWFYRNTLRFPRAFLLVPIGVAAAWFLNSVRIASFILIGGILPEAGARGFHSVAGWLLFNLLACGLIWGSWRFELLTETSSGESSISLPSSASASARLLPFLAMVAASMTTRALSPGFDIFYPLQVVVAAAALWFYRREFTSMSWRPSAAAILAGALVFALWFALGRAAPATSIRLALGEMPRLEAGVWASLWIVGSIIVVPIVEELAFRDYLRRKLTASNFESVALDHFTWISFLGSSLLFGAFSGEWLAGTVAGMIFALVACRRGVLSDAILAHATSNGLRCACALAAGRLLLVS
jgi:exosortase E/protease (VPEID-CTERM system)